MGTLVVLIVVTVIGYALLWQIRNQVVPEGKQLTGTQQVEGMWAMCLRQLRAVAKKESARPETRTQGIYLKLSIDCLTEMAAEAPRAEEPSPPPAPWLHNTEMALSKRLRLYQEANNA
ncbi:hypothetical protein PR003_g29309 [Phytophthora rubi]|uniref:Uncharacterized protein n=1 Tax=Phytophthora rubi TaxID=129364 RepID=A0A6A3H995_9STRA|nr:hypothetical protein PR002_g28388 [Phytophthora rubi]KAE8967259.1 hypothetical protein PR001_g28156 [Phytophthora rubi]KAE9275535.1 hypothetical protein PR003_g29309 [Phytophthora rubi]